MKRILGILIIVLVLYGLILASAPTVRGIGNHQQLGVRLGLYGFLTLGAGVLIISGGIDLSIGSVCALSAISLGVLLNKRGNDSLAALAVLLGAYLGLMASFWVGRFAGPMRTKPQRLLLSVGAVSAVAAGVVLGLVAAGALLSSRTLLSDGLNQVLAVVVVLVGASLIGLSHGLFVTRLRLQPFIVTLCGLFIYRGLAYWLALPEPMVPIKGLLRFLSFGSLYGNEPLSTGSAGNVGIGERSKDLKDLIFYSTGYLRFTGLVDLPVLGPLFRSLAYVPMRLWLLLLVAALAMVLLHFSVYGRYLYAVGSNEQAARYAGVATDRYKILAYMLCSLLAALGGMIEFLDLQTAAPSNAGNWYELYAITGAVLGGCSLRGGEGTVIGMLLGALVLPLLRNLINFSSIPDDLTTLVIGFALLVGTIVDEMLKRRSSARG